MSCPFSLLVCMYAQSCLTLCCPHGLQPTRLLWWATEWSELCSSPEDLPDPGIEPGSPALAGRFFTIEFLDSSVGKESTCNAGDPGSIPRLGRSTGEGKGYPLQYSGLENSMDCIVHGVTESDTTEWLSLHFRLEDARSSLGDAGLWNACYWSETEIRNFHHSVKQLLGWPKRWGSSTRSCRKTWMNFLANPTP